MPRFDPRYLPESGDDARAYELRRSALRGHYLGAAAPPQPKTSAEVKDLFRKNRAAAQREIDRRMPGKVTINANGSLHLVNPLTPLNRAMADIMRPFHGAIDALPSTPEVKRKLKTQPITFFIDLFDPVLDAIRDGLIETMERGLNRNTQAFRNRTVRDTGEVGKGGFVYDLSTPPFMFTLNDPKFKSVNIWLYQPGDDLFDDESRGIILRMRMLLAYFVLFFRKPVELQLILIEKGLEFLFGKEDAALVSTLGKEENTKDAPFVVDMLPVVGGGTIEYYGKNRAGQHIYSVTKREGGQGPKTSYYTLSKKGRYQRGVFLREEWDAKYEAYKNDKITNPIGVVLYGPRMNWLKDRGNTEAQARNVIAAEDNFPKQFAETRNLPDQFRVYGVPAYGGGVAPVTNGPRPDIPPRSWADQSGVAGYLGALGADPGTTTAAAKGAGDAATAAGGGQAGAAVIPGWLTVVGQVVSVAGGAAGAVAAVATGVATVTEAANRPEVAKQEAAKAEAEARAAEAAAEAEKSKASAASFGAISPVLILGGAAAAVALFAILKNRKTT